MHDRTPQFLSSRQVWILTIVGIMSHIAFAVSRITVSLAAIDQGASELVVGTLASEVVIDHFGHNASFVMLAVTPTIATAALGGGVLTLPAMPGTVVTQPSGN